MPQKRNPDAAELVRAKTGRIVGALTGLIVVLKGLPLAYAKDMQEDKEPVFDAFESLELSIAAMTGMVADMEPDVAAMRKAAGAGFSTATDLADWLVRDARPAVPRGPPRHRADRGGGRDDAASRSTGCRSTPCRRSSRASPTTSIRCSSVRQSVKSRTQPRRHGAGERAPRGPPLAEAAGEGKGRFAANLTVATAAGLTMMGCGSGSLRAAGSGM